MKRFLLFSIMVSWCLAGTARADGRPGTVTWSDGRKIDGAISLSPGKTLRLYVGDKQVSIQLDEVKEIRIKPEKEEMWEGFYFPNVGQATQVKTGEVYPIRYLRTEITLADGKVLEGHLFTTMLYVETDEATEKVVLLAKQTGANGQKMADLPYTTDIHFDGASPSSGTTQIDLTQANFKDMQPIVVFAKSDMGALPASQSDAAKPVWTVPMADPSQLLFSIQAADGVHVEWPDTPVDPAIQQVVKSAIDTMQDYYDTRYLLGCFAESDDVYSLIMMKRVGPSYDMSADTIPWSLVVLHWKYDADAKKVSLLNKIMLATGRLVGNSKLPAVFNEAKLMHDISAIKPNP